MVKVIAHRGSSGGYPENTMTAFLEAERVQADGIEMDVRFTKDKKLVVIHDETVDRTTDGKGKVSSFNLTDLKKLNAGAKHPNYHNKEEILTLKEYLDWAHQTNLILHVELKYSKDTYPEYESDVLALLATYNLDERITISSFNAKGLAKIAKMNPDIKLGLLYSKKIDEPITYIEKMNIGALHPSKKIINKKTVTEAINNDVPIRIFTVNAEKELKKYFLMNCSAIITDYPKRALQVKRSLQK